MIELRYETIRKISTKKTPLPVDLVGVFLPKLGLEPRTAICLIAFAPC
jgi:hypothetical protein